MRFLIQLLAVTVVTVFSAPVFSHAGPHDNKNCFISINNNTLRFSGYQFQGIHPDESFCRVFPYLGSVIIKIEPVNDELSDKKVALQLLKLNFWTNYLSNTTNGLLLKQTPLQNLNNGVNMIQADIQQRGIYALNIKLQMNDKKIVTQTFLFLIGIPVTKILVLFSMMLLIVLALFITIKTMFKKRLEDDRQESVSQN